MYSNGDVCDGDVLGFWPPTVMYFSYGDVFGFPGPTVMYFPNGDVFS
jgi:hypothetical protein